MLLLQFQFKEQRSLESHKNDASPAIRHQSASSASKSDTATATADKYRSGAPIWHVTGLEEDWKHGVALVVETAGPIIRRRRRMAVGTVSNIASRSLLFSAMMVWRRLQSVGPSDRAFDSK